MPTVPLSKTDTAQQCMPYIHLAFSVGSREAVAVLTDRLLTDGYLILDGPRTTSVVCCESIVLDAAGDRIEQMV